MTFCINPQCHNPQNSDNVLFCQSCGSELLLQGRYRAIRELGGGGFGKTYEVREGTSSKVLKILINNSPKAVELFQREAQVLSQLIYPGIPRVEPNGYFIFYPKDSQQPIHCLVMEKIEGLNLREYLKQKGRPIDPELATRWLTELVPIIQQVHNQGILHRDIKPQNIILKPDGKLALIDFGAVQEGTRTEVATQGAGGTSISSTGYTPIEQINGQAVPQSDFYALGRTFIFLLTGKEPNDRAMYDALNDELKWRSYASGVSSQLADLIDHMAARLPKQRPANAQAILQALSNGRTPPPVQPVGGEDIEIELRITAPEALAGTSKPVTFSRAIYSGGTANVSYEAKTLTVNIPPNSQDGTRLRLTRQGNQGSNGGSLGDVYVRLFVQAQGGNETGLEFAGFWRRFPAFIIDVTISAVIFILVRKAVFSLIYLNQVAILSAMFCVFFYHIFLEISIGATLGKIVTGITVTNLRGNKISLGKSLSRFVIKICSILCFGLGIIATGIAIFNSPRKQGLHDYWTKSIVVLKRSLRE